MHLPLTPDVQRSLRELPRGYQTIFARLLEVVESDPRIRALWLAGSVGRGTGDAGSDLDVVVTIADADFEAFCTEWRRWLAKITPTVIAREIPGLSGSFYSLTPGCERFDVVVERAGDPDLAARASRTLVLDRDGSAPEVDLARSRPEQRGPDARRLEGIVEELLREQAIFPAAVIARRDWLLGVVGVMATHRLLYELFVEANQPLAPMGIKQWSAKLTDAQRRLLESLPVPGPRPDALIAAMLAAREAMLTVGRETVERHGGIWPTALDESVATYYANELGASSASDASTSLTTRIDNPGE
jgi:hypothetical protein